MEQSRTWNSRERKQAATEQSRMEQVSLNMEQSRTETGSSQAHSHSHVDLPTAMSSHGAVDGAKRSAACCDDQPRRGRWSKPQRGGGYSGTTDEVDVANATRVKEIVDDADQANQLRRPQKPVGCVPYVFDMETGDPDDVVTLLLLASKPSVDLRAVTLTPGSLEQVALVRWILHEVGLNEVRIGAQNWPANKDKSCMNGDFYKSFGRLRSTLDDCECADIVLRECCDEKTTLLTGGPLHNLGAALLLDGFSLGRWVAQGGFAGDGVVPPELQMSKFKGKRTMQTWNFNGNQPAAEAALASDAIGRKVCVSKNVCHQTAYDGRMHESFRAAMRDSEAASPSTRAQALQMLFAAMDTYTSHKGDAKKVHDPLALCVALNESVCTLAEVALFRDRCGWGSRLAPGNGTWISVDYDDELFRQMLVSS